MSDNQYVLEVAEWHGNHWSEWKETKMGPREELLALANAGAVRHAYNWRARIILVVEEINT